MEIKINGKIQAFGEDKLSLTELLKRSKVERPEVVTVQLNGKFVDKQKFDTAYVKNADEVDFLYFMGGG